MCFRLSDHINSLHSERPYKSFKTHISRGAKLLKRCQSPSRATVSGTQTQNISERDTVLSVSYLVQVFCEKDTQSY